MVEDELKYLEPAKGLGMTTILVGQNKKPYADYCIQDIREIRNICRGK